jgi:glycerol-3-phosphate dehydrogenase subunit B
MWNGVQSLRAGTPCVIVGFEGLKGFSPPQITTVLQHQWRGLRPVWISFPTPASSSDIYAEGLALRFDLPEERRLLADLLRPNIVDAGAVGLPAVLGIYRSKQALEELESALGLPVFEIPTTPPSVPGIRLKEAFASGLRRNGVRLFHQFRVLEVSTAPGVKFHLAVGRQNPEVMIRAPGVILATGRFLGGGLHAGRSGIRETIFDLPVKQPEDRELWHRVNPMDPRGHPVNQAGLEVDQSFRPLKNGRPAFENVYAAGSILAHQDWMRMKCGSGLSIATAFGAVEAFRTARRSEP